MEDIEVYSIGIVYLSVCAKNTKSIEEITEFVNDNHPTGIESNWVKSEDTHFKGGQTNPCTCERDDTRQHFLFNC